MALGLANRGTWLCALLAALVLIAAAPGRATSTVWLTSLDLTKVKQGWGTPQIDRSISEKPLSIGGKVFEHGLGSHGPMTLYIDLAGGSERFTASVGLDDQALQPSAGLIFQVFGDDKLLWKSPLMRRGDKPQEVDVNLHGMKTMLLFVSTENMGLSFAHADWAEACFEVSGTAPKSVDAPVEKAVILTPKPSAKPRINGARVFGVRPGSPFMFTIAASGRRPMKFAAKGLPAGLKLDPKTGFIAGSMEQPGTYNVTLKSANSLGTAKRDFRIVCGDTLDLTPEMGWNSWYCWREHVTDKVMRDSADAIVKTGLINHGYTYVNIDDGWGMPADANDTTHSGAARDKEGKVKANASFPDMKAMTDYIHSKGLKAGIYSSPGRVTCAGFEGCYGHEELDAERFAEWGFDFLKYDWCSGGDDLKKSYALMSGFLRKQKRDFVLNLCEYGMGNVWEWGKEVGGNSWRIGPDLGGDSTTADRVYQYAFGLNGTEKWIGPGAWNDPDYLMFGNVAIDQPSPLTPDEQYSQMSLYAILSAPFIIAGDVTKLDDFSLSLLTNDEVIDVDQDPLGRQGHRVATDGYSDVWMKDLQDGSKVVGLFNVTEMSSKAVAKWSDLGLSGKYIVRDLWSQKDLGIYEDKFGADLPRHGVVLVRLSRK